MYPCCTNGHSTYMQWLEIYMIQGIHILLTESLVLYHVAFFYHVALHIYKNATLMRIIHISWNRYLWIFFAVLHRNYINSRNYKHTSFIFSVYEEKMSGHWANRAIQACHVPMTIRKQGDWSGKFHVNSHCPIVLDWQVKAYW